MENNKRPKKTALVDKDLCVACGCCVKSCPKAAISIYKGIYAVVNDKICVGCGRCYSICPASVIEMAVSEG